MTVSMLSRRGLTRTVQSLAEDVRLFQQADGVGLARCGGEGEEVGSLRAGGQIKSVGVIA